MELIVVRHGETEENARRIIQGHGHGTLTAKGQRQIKQAAKQLANEHIDVMYSSDLRRCVETARAIHAYHQNIPLILRTELREFRFGIFQGLPATWFSWVKRVDGGVKLRLPGIETPQMVRERLVPFLNHVFEKHAGETVLLVTHGGPIRIIRSQLESIPLKNLFQEAVPNCSIWRFTMSKPIR